MKKLRTLLCFLLAFGLVLSLFGCAGDDDADDGDDTEETTAAPDDDSDPDPTDDEADYSEPIQVSMNVMNAERCGNHARNEYIEEKFNLTFEYVPVSWGDWNEKIRTWIATDDAPDLIWWDLKGATAHEYKSWARQGAFSGISQEDLGNRDNLLEVYNTADSIDALTVDGMLYAWPSLRDNPEEAQNCYTSHWSYRRDWAQEVGHYNEDDIYTWDEWIELLRAVMDEDPGNNGAANAGLVMPTWAFPHAPVLFINPPPAEGNESCSYYYDDDAGEYIWPAATEAYRTGLEMTHEMFQEGLIYQDNMVFSGNEFEDMIKSGLAFATYNVTGSLNNWTTDMIRDGVIEERSDFGIAMVLGWDGTWYMTQTEDYWTVTALSHNISDEAKQRVFDFWDYLKTDEGILLRAYGIEGVDYEKVGDGLTDIELLWEYDEDLEEYIDPYVNDEFNEANGAENARVVLGPGTTMYQYEERDRLWQTFASGDVPTKVQEFDYYVSFGSAENKDRYGTFNVEAKEKFTALIAEPAGTDVGAMWDEWVEEVMPTVQLVLDEINGGELE